MFILLACLILSLSTCKTKQTHSTLKPVNQQAIIPYQVGNYWIYQPIAHLKKPAIDYPNDTLLVLSHEQSAEGLKVNLNTAKWLVKANGDSIFVRCQGRGGGEFVMPLYHRTSNTATFSTCLGDVMIDAKVQKLKDPVQVQGKSYKNCYRFEITPNEIFFLADGIGVIKWEYYNQSQELMHERVLIDYQIK